MTGGTTSKGIRCPRMALTLTTETAIDKASQVHTLVAELAWIDSYTGLD